MNLDPYQQQDAKPATAWAPVLRDLLRDAVEHPPFALRLGRKQRDCLTRVVADVEKTHRILDGYDIPGGLLSDRIAIMALRGRLVRP
jgi:hypothetical protein